MSTCSHGRHRTYTTQESAQKAVDAMKRNGDMPLDTTVKQCGGCGRWRVWEPKR